MFTMKINAEQVMAAFDGAKARITNSMAKTVAELTQKLQARVVARAPVKTGKLRRSIFQDVVVDDTRAVGRVFVSPDTSYARFVEYGTAPHDIYPSAAKALAFQMNGATVFAKHVRHPGTQPQLYLHGPFEEMKPEIVAKVKAEVLKALR